MNTGPSATAGHSATTVRAVTSSDIEAVETLLRKAGLPFAGVTDQFTRGFAVAEQGDRMIGVAGVEVYGADGLLRSVAVDDVCRGQGLGVLLVQERLAWARAQGLRDVYLLTTTAPVFFERLGFTRIARADAPSHMQQAHEFASVCESTAITMKLSL